MIKVLAGGMLAALMAMPLAGQQPGVASRVQGALDTRMVQPECKLEGGGDFRVSSGKTYLKTGIEGSGDPINKVNALKNGARVITEAITTAGQAKNPAAWYFLGRIYLQQGDVVGADSAFAKAESLAPGCKDDIRRYRYRVWAALVNAGSGFRKDKQDDSAIMLFRAANQIEQSLPLGYVFLADVMNDRGQTDSALYYFGRGAATEPTDSNMIKARNQSAFNHGVMLLNAGRGQDAVVALHRYLALQPTDVAGKKALAQAFRAAGKADSAQVLERELIASAGSTTGDPTGEVSEDDLIGLAVKQFNDKNYKEAAATFEKVVARNPWNRDAIFNQANAYLALSDGVSMAKAAEKLITIEPLAEYDHSLRAQGYKLAKNQDGVYKAIVAREALLVNLEVSNFNPAADSATLTAKATGREARDEANKILPPKPLAITVEFLGDGGTVVASQDVQIPALKQGASQPIAATGKASGIKAWRYKVK
jgi:tetratricopeptide (TPR) repeat protein